MITPQSALTLKQLRDHRDEILALAEQYGAYNVRVFGSVARGDATPTSDIDFLVNFRPGTSLFELAGLRMAMQALLGTSVDVVEDHPGLRQRFRARIQKDVVLL